MKLSRTAKRKAPSRQRPCGCKIWGEEGVGRSKGKEVGNRRRREGVGRKREGKGGREREGEEEKRKEGNRESRREREGKEEEGGG